MMKLQRAIKITNTNVEAIAQQMTETPARVVVAMEKLQYPPNESHYMVFSYSTSWDEPYAKWTVMSKEELFDRYEFDETTIDSELTRITRR